MSFPKIKSGLIYTPTEFVESLIENIDYQDRLFVIKQVRKIKLSPINVFLWCWDIWKNRFTITVSHKNYNSYLLYHAYFCIIILLGNIIFHHMKWKKFRFILLVVVVRVLYIMQQNKSFRNFLMTSTSKIRCSSQVMVVRRLDHHA